MDKVIELGQLVEIDLANTQKCSVCLRFKPKDSYTQPNLRTNCYECYTTPSSEWDKLRADALLAESNPSQEARRFKKMKEIEEVSISVEEMIEALKQLPAGSRLIMSESGYYSTSEYAEIYLPQKVKNAEGLDIFEIGSSNQMP